MTSGVRFILCMPPGWSVEQVLNVNETGSVTTEYLTDLVYELLDAHCDTMSLADEFAREPAWAAHLDYLQGLQRVGREALARMTESPL